jgi:hypothetical protein
MEPTTGSQQQNSPEESATPGANVSGKDFGEWLRERAGAQPEPAGTATGRPRRHVTIDAVLGVVAGVLALLALVGWLFPPYHPVRFLCLYVLGASAALVGFLGLYALAFSIVKYIETRARLSLPLVIAALVLGLAGIGVDGRERALEQDAVRKGKSVPNVERARARGWI